MEMKEKNRGGTYLLVEGSDLFFNRAEALLNIDFSKYSQATQEGQVHWSCRVGESRRY
jgi:hypothetical protein